MGELIELKFNEHELNVLIDALGYYETGLKLMAMPKDAELAISRERVIDSIDMLQTEIRMRREQLNGISNIQN